MMPPVSAQIFGLNVRLAPGLRPKGTRARARFPSDRFTRALTDKSSRSKVAFGASGAVPWQRLNGRKAAVGGEVAPQLVIRLETTAKWAFPTTMGQSGGADRGLPVPRVLFLSGYQM